MTVSTDGAQQSITVTAADNAGNEGSPTVEGINVDSTAPALSFEGVQDQYGIADIVTIACTRATTCRESTRSTVTWCPNVSAVDYSSWSGDGSSITGTLTVEATAEDLAGNTTTITETFTIVVDDASLADLVGLHAGNGPGVNGLSPSSKKAITAHSSTR